MILQRLYILPLLLLLAAAPLSAQEVLRASRIQVKGGHRHLPALGLPVRTDGTVDGVIRFRDGRWTGADSPAASPRWTMWPMTRDSLARPEAVAPALEVCRKWAGEVPNDPASVVYGPLRDGWFVAVCKKIRRAPGWKSIGFFLPQTGFDALRGIFNYSVSVNWIEHNTGYDLFPRLPSHLQEIIEEMTAAELLCPFQEVQLIEPDLPDREVDRDMEEDFREYN